MSGGPYYAVPSSGSGPGPGLAGLWECSEDGTVVYGTTGQARHDREHEERDKLAGEVAGLRQALLLLTNEVGNDLGALTAQVGRIGRVQEALAAHGQGSHLTGAGDAQDLL